MTPYEYMLKFVLKEPVYWIGYDPGIMARYDRYLTWFDKSTKELKLYPFQKEILDKLTKKERKKIARLKRINDYNRASGPIA